MLEYIPFHSTYCLVILIKLLRVHPKTYSMKYVRPANSNFPLILMKTFLHFTNMSFKLIIKGPLTDNNEILLRTFSKVTRYIRVTVVN